MPLWSANGHEVYFMGLDARSVFAVPTQLGATVSVGTSRKIAEGQFLAATTGFRPYDVGADGRIVVIASTLPNAAPLASPDVILVQHWFEELKRLVPSK